MARKVRISMTKVNHKIAADANQDRKADGFQEPQCPPAGNKESGARDQDVPNGKYGDESENNRARGEEDHDTRESKSDACCRIGSLQHLSVRIVPPEIARGVKHVVDLYWGCITLCIHPLFENTPFLVELAVWTVEPHSLLESNIDYFNNSISVENL